MSLGSSTRSISWMTPLEAGMSAATTFAPSTTAFPLTVRTSMVVPWRVSAIRSRRNMPAGTVPGSMWQARTSTSLSRLAGLRSMSSLPGGSFAKASSVGARSVSRRGPRRFGGFPFAATAS